MEENTLKSNPGTPSIPGFQVFVKKFQNLEKNPGFYKIKLRKSKNINRFLF